MAAKKKVAKQVKAHSSGDERYTSLDRTMKRFKYEKDSLLEVLNSAQEVFGYLSEDLLIYIAKHLNVPMSQVYGVATFYHLFTFDPQGEHNCVVCKGTACHVKGADWIIHSLADEFDVKAGKTTADGFLSLTIARCVGSCGLAPVVVLDGQVYGKETPEAVTDRVLDLVSHSRADTAHPVEAA